MNLIIVESPTKAKTIEKFLGSEYKVLSSYGHIRDLPKSKLGIETEKDFEPKYITPQKARKVLKALKEKASDAEKIILATDEDREGEAISWHLLESLKSLKDKSSFQRIAFHEITEEAIKKALKNPREINLNLVNSQQARRVLDRLVGYKLSPFLWKKVVKGLSAGRVQSAALKIVVDREEERRNFKKQEYWTIEALLKKEEQKDMFSSLLIKYKDKKISKFSIKSKNKAEKIVKDLKGSEFKVQKIEKKEVKKNPPPPFTTSSLQQESWKKLKLPSKITMMTAQRLYETGLITYHRTDSLSLSSFSQIAAKNLIEKDYGKEYWPGFSRKYKTKSKTAQEAHEAIRPSMPEKKPENLKNKLEKNQYLLYYLIWKRFMACQMSQALFEAVSVDISVKDSLFRSSGQTLKFDGFLKVYKTKFKEENIPLLEKDETLKLLKLNPAQHFTQPPSRYTEATLIKALEKEGIGRPSTYAPIISTIQARNYIEKDENRKFKPTEIGELVSNVLKKHFPKIVNLKFTAQMEKNLDKIASGEKKWVPVIREFYTPFEKNLEKKYQEVSKKDLAEQKTDKVCPKCGSPIVLKMGRFGKFYACSNFPECKYTEPAKDNKIGVKCPKCGSEIIEKKTRKGKTFWSCSNWPKCDYASWDKPTKEKCPKCGSMLLEGKRGKIICSNKECDYKKYGSRDNKKDI
jgi:DNA topoisomerase I